MSLSILYATFNYSQGSLTQVFVAMMCTEFSTIFFNIAWILRAIGFRDSKVVDILEKLFAILFVLLRNIHVTLLIFVLWNDMALYGVFQIGIFVTTFMQFFWSYKILFSSREKKKKEE